MNAPIRHVAIFACFAAVTGSAVPLSVVSYSTIIDADYISNYRDNTYSGAQTVNGHLLTYSGGQGNLTDGRLDNFVAWIGEWNRPETMNPRITIELASSSTITDLSLYLWRADNLSIRVPSGLTVQYSNDGITWGGRQEITLTGSEVQNQSTGWANFSLLGTGRFVELTLANSGFDTFMSELAIGGAVNEGTNNVPEAGPGIPLTALTLLWFCYMHKRQKLT